MKSWRTTLCGVLMIVSSAISLIAMPLLDADPLTVANYEAFVAAVIAGIGLIAARDNGVSSEAAGAVTKL